MGWQPARGRRSPDAAQGQHVASCHLYTHPLGGDVRAMVDGELWRTAAGRNAMTLVDLALGWREQFMATGWTRDGRELSERKHMLRET